MLMRRYTVGDLSGHEQRLVVDFIQGSRDYEATLPALWHFLGVALSRWDNNLHPQLLPHLTLLVMKAWQHRSFSDLADTLQLPGRRGMLEALRDACAQVQQTLML